MKHKSLYEIFEYSASLRPNKIAIYEKNTKISYAKLNEYIDSVATYLRTYGIKKGDRVGIFMLNSWQYIVTILAISKVGGVIVPINTFLKSSELSYILKDAEIDLIFASDELFNIIKGSIAVINYGQVVWLGDDVRGTRFEKLLTIKDKIKKEVVSLDDEAAIFYTSGTTGKHKGAVLTNRNMLANIPYVQKHLKLTHKDRVFIFLPFFHIYSFNVGIVFTIAYGMSAVISRSIYPLENLIKDIVKYRVTVIFGVPELYKVLVNNKLPLSFKLFNRLKLVATGGSFIKQETLIKLQSLFKNAKVIEGYGLTETASIVSLNLFDEQKLNSVGKVIESCQVKIVDENRKPLEANQIGEIAIKGENVINSYLNCDCGNIKDGWLYSGDIGYLSNDGYLYIIDRKSDIIISKGFNIYPKEVENVLDRYPGVKKSAVIGIADKENGEIPIAFLEVEDMQVDEAKLHKYASGFLANYKVPKKFLIIDKIPRTTTGKIMKYKLQELYKESF